MPDIVVILAEPKFAGNIGFVARSMSNFGLAELVLYNPCELGHDAYRFAKHGREILERATVVSDYEEAFKSLDLVVGTTGITTGSEKKFLRQPLTPREFVKHVNGAEGRLGLVFGREDYGLWNEELARCDILVSIPTSEDNPILNISHAATVMFYELFSSHVPKQSRRLAGGKEKETLNRLFQDLLEATDYPEHKREKTRVMFRRLVSRSGLSTWEFHILAGVLSRAVKRIEKGNG